MDIFTLYVSQPLVLWINDIAQNPEVGLSSLGWALVLILLSLVLDVVQRKAKDNANKKNRGQSKKPVGKAKKQTIKTGFYDLDCGQVFKNPQKGDWLKNNHRN